MTEYNFLKDTCKKCHKVRLCIEIYDKKGNCYSLCETCLSWTTLVDAKTKDNVIEIFAGIEDLD